MSESKTTAKVKPTARKKQTTFEKLSAINVNKYVEKKNGLTYLSWAFAWSEVKKNCPSATYSIGETEYDEHTGFMCHTSVTIENETLQMWLPVMDSKNQSMKKQPYSYQTRYGQKEVAAATTFDINKTIMRCLVKNLAMFGLGIYIYAGEDMPQESEVVSSKTPKKKESTNNLPTIDTKSDEWGAVLKFVKENKAIGYKRLVDKISTKYNLEQDALKEIMKSTKA